MCRVRIEWQVQLFDEMLRAIGVKVDLLTDFALSRHADIRQHLVVEEITGDSRYS